MNTMLNKSNRNEIDEFLSDDNQYLLTRLNQYYFVPSPEQVIKDGGVFYKDDSIELSVQNNVERMLNINELRYDKDKGWFKSDGLGGWVADSMSYRFFWDQHRRALTSILYDAFKIESPHNWSMNDDPSWLTNPLAMLMAYWASISIRRGPSPVRDATRDLFMSMPSVQMSEIELEHSYRSSDFFNVRSTIGNETGWFLKSEYADARALCESLSYHELQALDEMIPLAEPNKANAQQFGVSEALKVLQSAGMRLASDRGKRESKIELVPQRKD